MLRRPWMWAVGCLAGCLAGCQAQGAPSGFGEESGSPPAPVYVDDTPPDAGSPPAPRGPDAASPDAGELPKPPVSTGLQYNGAIGFDRRLP